MMNELPTMASEGLESGGGSAPQATGSVESKPDTTPASVSDQSGTKGTSEAGKVGGAEAGAAPIQNVEEGKGSGAASEVAGAGSQSPELLKVTEDRDKAMTELTGMKQQFAMLQGQFEALKTSMQTPQANAGAAASKRDYDSELKDVLQKLEEGDLSMAEALSKQAEILKAQSQEVVQVSLQEQAGRQGAAVLEQNFLKANPDYIQFVREGGLNKIRGENSEWGGLHDEVSAYFHNKWKQAEAATEAAVQKAVKEAEARMITQFKAKGHAAVLGDGGTPGRAPEGEKDPATKNSKGFGGVTQVLADRLSARRSTRAAK